MAAGGESRSEKEKKLKAKLNGRCNPPLPRPPRSFCPLQQSRAP